MYLASLELLQSWLRIILFNFNDKFLFITFDLSYLYVFLLISVYRFS